MRTKIHKPDLGRGAGFFLAGLHAPETVLPVKPGRPAAFDNVAPDVPTEASGASLLGLKKRVADAHGEVYGKLFLEKRCGTTNNGKNLKQSLWLASCECGREIVKPLSYFRKGYFDSCGCIKKYGPGIPNGATFRGKVTLTYKSWRSIKARCLNEKNHKFKYYGGRGISVCERWADSFPNFLIDMGRRPSKKYSIDRINNDGNYEPGNCRWATAKQQASNRRYP